MRKDENLQEFAVHCKMINTLSELWSCALDFFHDRGVAMVSYHSDDGMRTGQAAWGVFQEGFPDDWVCHYIGNDLIKVDPIPGLSHTLARPFFWSETPELVPLTAAHRGYLERLAEADLGDGLAVQVFGPNLRNAYVGLGFGHARPTKSAELVFTLQCAAQIAHIRYCELTANRLARSMDVTPREQEILSWIAQGKSNSVIADILGISPHTVDTLTRRIFDKLKVNDRTSAAILGIGSGLVNRL